MAIEGWECVLRMEERDIMDADRSLQPSSEPGVATISTALCSRKIRTHVNCAWTNRPCLYLSRQQYFTGSFHLYQPQILEDQRFFAIIQFSTFGIPSFQHVVAFFPVWFQTRAWIFYPVFQGQPVPCGLHLQIKQNIFGLFCQGLLLIQCKAAR